MKNVGLKALASFPFFNLFWEKNISVNTAPSGIQWHRWAVWGHFGVQRVTRSRQHPGFCFLSLQMKQAQGCFYSVRYLFATLKETHKRKVCASVNLQGPLVPAGKVTRKLGKRGTNHYLHPCSSTLGVRRKRIELQIFESVISAYLWQPSSPKSTHRGERSELSI